MAIKLNSENVKTRAWSFLVYLDSAPEFWKDILLDLACPCLISPLHDKDIWTKLDEAENPNHVAGTKKKPHHHVVIVFDNTKTIKQAQEISNFISGVRVQHVISQRGYARYLCHLDHKDKAQYDIADVVSLGIDYQSLIDIKTDRYWLIREIITFIDDNNILSFHTLLRFCMENNEAWFRNLCDSGTYVIKEYLKSKYWYLNKSHN